MDFLPILVLILFVLVGGVIAVIADNLGRKWGKKRLQLHRKIRPRYSAMIATFFTGMLITISTIVLISVASKDVRTWLREGYRAVEQRDRLQAEVATFGELSRKLQAQIASGNTQISSLRRTQSDLSKQVESEKKKYLQARRDLGSIQSRLSGALTRVSNLRSEQARLRSDLATLNTNLGNRQKEYMALQKSWDYLKNERDQIMKNRDDLDRQVQGLGEQIRAKGEEIRQLQQDRDRLQQEIDAKQKAKEQADHDLAEAQAQLAEVQNQLNAAREIATGQFLQARTQPMMFQQSEELLRVPVRANTSKDGVREQMERAIISARSISKDRGAADEPNGIHYADLLPTRDRNGNSISVEAQLDMLATRLAGSGDEHVLRVVSVFNVFRGEGVIIRFDDAPNPVVYHQGQMLAEVWVDGRQERAKILEVLDGLGVKVRARAIQDHMIPSGENAQFGSVSSDQILDVYEQIREAARMVRVQALARQSTRAADPLLLTLIVK